MKSATTYAKFAENDLTSRPQGRFQKVVGTGVVGVPEYPPQPPNSPWAQPDPGVEPPLGYPIDQQEPVGTAAEIERSLASLPSPAAPTSELIPSFDVVETGEGNPEGGV